ncbi:hypothetical protein [Azospirillum sp. B21]|uniref:hypothetical protein n=1 Tax=Azospirillum sp. B21 TaxID=2607496 RepID=UPI001FFFF15E|nr:hypothetical protein [Azospirillum sp. B21]
MKAPAARPDAELFSMTTLRGRSGGTGSPALAPGQSAKAASSVSAAIHATRKIRDCRYDATCHAPSAAMNAEGSDAMMFVYQKGYEAIRCTRMQDFSQLDCARMA